MKGAMRKSHLEAELKRGWRGVFSVFGHISKTIGDIEKTSGQKMIVVQFSKKSVP